MKRHLFAAAAAALLLAVCSACGYSAGEPVPNEPVHTEPSDSVDAYVPETENGDTWVDVEDLPGMDEPVSRREVMELILDVIGAEPGELAVSAVEHQEPRLSSGE